jgi:hypothetical protein
MMRLGISREEKEREKEKAKEVSLSYILHEYFM